jgi:hypothetical protein
MEDRQGAATETDSRNYGAGGAVVLYAGYDQQRRRCLGDMFDGLKIGRLHAQHGRQQHLKQACERPRNRSSPVVIRSPRITDDFTNKVNGFGTATAHAGCGPS